MIWKELSELGIMAQGFGNMFMDVRGAGVFQNFRISEISGTCNPSCRGLCYLIVLGHILLNLIWVLSGRHTCPTTAFSENRFKNILMKLCLLYYLSYFY